jgi:hypothetical protein
VAAAVAAAVGGAAVWVGATTGLAQALSSRPIKSEIVGVRSMAVSSK